MRKDAFLAKILQDSFRNVLFAVFLQNNAILVKFSQVNTFFARSYEGNTFLARNLQESCKKSISLWKIFAKEYISCKVLATICTNNALLSCKTLQELRKI